MKKILFVSGIDFKEKSIQVIRKTPEAYYKHGWEVHYLVGRDESKNGDYFYEPIINPTGINIYRFNVPLAFLDSLWNHPIWKALIFRIRNFFLVLILAIRATSLMKKNDFDVVYGYELYGVLALRLTRWLGCGKSLKFVIRFQGVYAGEWERKKQKFRKVLNWAYFFGLKTKADLCIMTNDGTKGLDLLWKLNNKTPVIKFYVNGVDSANLDDNKTDQIKKKHFQESKKYFLSVCRLVPQKRVDRSLRLIHAIVYHAGVTNVRYNIVGSGAELENLKKLVNELAIEEYVSLLGSVPNGQVKYFLASTHFFLSMDAISNVGNPLLEAIRSNKFIITINNGDTGSWIRHRENGLIYDVPGLDLERSDYLKMANEVKEYLVNEAEYNKIVLKIKETEISKLWTWDDRMREEVSTVDRLFF